MKYVISFLLLSILMISASNYSELPKYALRKIDKSLNAAWPDKELSKEEINVSADDLSFKVHPKTLFEIKSEGELVGYMYIDKAPSKFDYFDFMVLFNSDLEIIDSEILVYREDYGGEIGSPRWLGQFNGKNHKSSMKLGEDIQAVSGATISCKSATKGIKKLALRIAHLKQEGLL